MAHPTPESETVREGAIHQGPAVDRSIERLVRDARRALHVVIATDGLDCAVAHLQAGLERRRTEGLPPIDVGLVVPAQVTGATRLTEVEHEMPARITIVDADLRLTTFVRDDTELLAVEGGDGGETAYLTSHPAAVHDVLAFLRLAGHHTTHPT